MGPRERLFCLTAIGLVLAARAGAQAPLPLELSWRAPAECPQAGAVRAELQRIVRVRSDVQLAPLLARAEVVHEGGRYTTRLHTEHEGSRGERALEARDCKTLVRTVTLVLALAFGPGVELTDDGASGEADAAVAPESTSGEASGKPRAPVAARADQHGVRESAEEPAVWDLAVLAGVGLQAGLLPSADFSLSLGGELGLGPYSVSLRAAALALTGITEHVGDGVDARFDGGALALLGCARVPYSELAFAFCTGGRAAALRGRSVGATDDGSDTAPWYALAAATSLTWPSDASLRLRFELGLALSITRPVFEIDGLRQVHRVPQLVPDLGLLLLVVF